MKKKFIYSLFMLCLVVPSIFLLASCCDDSNTLAITKIDGIKNEYIYKEPLPDENSEITIYFNNDTTEVVKMSDLKIRGLDTSKLGSSRVFISYDDFNYSINCQVKLKSIRKNNSAWLPTNLIANQNLNYRNYKLDIESFYGFETITLDNDGIEIKGLNTKVLDSSSIYSKSGTATITYGGQTLNHEYTVWFTEGYDHYLNGEGTKENYLVSVDGLRIMQSHGADGYLRIKNKSTTLSSIPITSWSYGTFLNLYSNGSLVAKYDYQSKIVYIMANVFNQFNYEISINIS